MDPRRGAWEIYRETMPVMIISLVGGIFAGAVLGTEVMTSAFREYPGLLLLLPAFLAARGNVYGSLGARISTGMHQGLIEPSLTWNRRLINAVAASFFNGIAISLFIAVLAWIMLLVLGMESASLAEFLLIISIAAVLTSITMIIGLLLLLFIGYRHGLDPDNLVGPIVSTLGDVFGVVFLLLGIAITAVVI